VEKRNAARDAELVTQQQANCASDLRERIRRVWVVRQLLVAGVLSAAVAAGCGQGDTPSGQSIVAPAASQRFIAEDNGCTDEMCYDEPDYWGDDGWGSDGGWGDSWDTFGDDGSDFPVTLFADEHDDTSFCSVGQNCHPFLPSSTDMSMFNTEITRLLNSSKPLCQMVGQAAQSWMTTQAVPIQYYNDYVRATNNSCAHGFLGGDTHPPNDPSDPYAGQVHIYKGSRSTSEILQTFRHEMGHVWGAPDGPPSTSGDPFYYNGEQIATYCN